MIRLALSRAAEADLTDILAYGGETFGWDAAEDYVASFDHAFVLLRDHPRAGAVHAEIRPPIRSLPHRRHRIFYDVLDDGITVQRILHMSMDVARHL
ncbi:type II toxin-antitoxin system RelE/ParE family toxin [Sphingomonas sp. MMS24-J13]|uniref:type II toxin-antitoxin system RelE/ParE family toxin n=1 Tax=Sphingomonas sp. MMS24-J13 TaxID=3238686 RepID=UPI00384F4083